MINFFSNIFGYILNFIYSFCQNYGLAIILFSILLKLVLLPLSIKQQKTMKKTTKIQAKVKEIQLKYKGNQEKINTETMNLYKKENMSPFSGCLSSIIQIILLFAMFYLVRSPLTYMKKVDTNLINDYKTQINQEVGDNTISQNYPEISIIKYISEKEETDSDLYVNMKFLGLDLSNIPKENYQDWTVYIIPALYVISSIISMKFTNPTTDKTKNNQKEDIIVESKDLIKKDGPENIDMSTQMNKQMKFFLPAMSVMIAIIAPLGLALYWLVNNICMTAERIIINKFLAANEEEEQND